MSTSEPLDLVLLQTFHEVARAGTVTAAATRLGRSQPAVSHRLRALERELGVPLFEKVGRRLQLTEYGRRLRDRCFDLMVLSRSIRDVVAPADAAPEGRIVIGALPTVVSHLLVPVIAELLDRCPALQLSFVFGYIADLHDHLRSGRVDLLVVVGDTIPHGVEVHELGATELVAVMSPAVAPRRTGRISLPELRARRYLAWDGPRDDTFDRVHEFASRRRLADARTPAIPHIESLRLLAAAGAGYAILPRYTVVADRDRLVALRPSGLNVRLSVSAVVRRQQISTPALREVLDAVRRIRVT